MHGNTPLIAPPSQQKIGNVTAVTSFFNPITTIRESSGACCVSMVSTAGVSFLASYLPLFYCGPFPQFAALTALGIACTTTAACAAPVANAGTLARDSGYCHCACPEGE